MIDVAAKLSSSELRKRRHGVMTDVSALGCRIRTAGRYNPGDFLMVSVPSFGPFGAFVVWARDGEVGLRFVRPLHRAVVQHVRQLRTLIDCPIERRWRSLAE